MPWPLMFLENSSFAPWRDLEKLRAEWPKLSKIERPRASGSSARTVRTHGISDMLLFHIESAGILTRWRKS